MLPRVYNRGSALAWNAEDEGGIGSKGACEEEGAVLLLCCEFISDLASAASRLSVASALSSASTASMSASMPWG